MDGKKEKREFDRHVPGTGVRGEVKKGGAGGKYVWGAETETEGPVALDTKDPNYDEDAKDTSTTKR
eukprot:CAMPEP_0184677748 /NCGR_PEP_ID=MMETSP0312-20130426/340_1 /TAXON_ID=31354 /ORGANISM="Compsopogon coeruleus, Strain SAG 36.94" /LENGTH=65 /DNA_ID=CAMNT_0027125817 /DNA_START=126 /DNA_END=323 /DNA_ORIENTATION=+